MIFLLLLLLLLGQILMVIMCRVFWYSPCAMVRPPCSELHRAKCWCWARGQSLPWLQPRWNLPHLHLVWHAHREAKRIKHHGLLWIIILFSLVSLYITLQTTQEKVKIPTSQKSHAISSFLGGLMRLPSWQLSSTPVWRAQPTVSPTSLWLWPPQQVQLSLPSTCGHVW